MPETTILVVDDEKKIVELVSAYLRREGYRVLAAFDGRQALELARAERPDLIVLDLMLPQIEGTSVCRLLRAEGNTVPIIMLTARSLEDDKLEGLDLGADDYVTKPFSPRELMARVRAVLRRSGEATDGLPQLVRGDLTVDRECHIVRVAGRPVELTPREFDLLETLARHPGRAFTRAELLDRAFGHDYEGLERTVDVHIMNLRRKLERNPAQPRYVQTVPGVGYRFGEA